MTAGKPKAPPMPEATSKKRIWIDNDGCPKTVRDLVFKLAQKRQITVVVVGNSHMHIPAGVPATMIVVPGGFDVADAHIVEHCATGDLVITADIPLAALIVAKGANGLDPRGTIFDSESIQDRLAVRNLMQELRSAGDIRGGAPPYAENDKKKFANALDRFMTAMLK